MEVDPLSKRVRALADGGHLEAAEAAHLVATLEDDLRLPQVRFAALCALIAAAVGAAMAGTLWLLAVLDVERWTGPFVAFLVVGSGVALLPWTVLRRAEATLRDALMLAGTGLFVAASALAPDHVEVSVYLGVMTALFVVATLSVASHGLRILFALGLMTSVATFINEALPSWMEPQIIATLLLLASLIALTGTLPRRYRGAVTWAGLVVSGLGIAASVVALATGRWPAAIPLAFYGAAGFALWSIWRGDLAVPDVRARGAALAHRLAQR